MKIIVSVFLLLCLFSCDILPTSAPIYRRIPAGSSFPTANSERSEFENLMAKDQINKKKTNAEVLTYLLNDPDPAELYTAIVIENTSGCNIILRLTGSASTPDYDLPIAGNSKNQFVIEKGNYSLRSTLCGATYRAEKRVTEPLILKLSAG